MEFIKLRLKKFIVVLKKEIRTIIVCVYEFIFHEKSWYLFPFRILILIRAMFVAIGSIEIIPRKRISWEDFNKVFEELIIKLRENNQIQWAGRIEGALYVSQSFYEIKGELKLALYELKKQKFVKQLNLKNDINSAITFLKKF